MKSYIGTKVVRAEPEAKFMPLAHPGAVQEVLPGYRVIYEDGYVSWSPKDVFERCYREISEQERGLMAGGDDK